MIEALLLGPKSLGAKSNILDGKSPNTFFYLIIGTGSCGGICLAVSRLMVVHAASIQDLDGAKLVLEHVPGRLTPLARIGADDAYDGELIDWMKTTYRCLLDIVKCSDKLKGFQVVPHQWVVERTFGWLNRYRRLAKDYGRSVEGSKAMFYIAMIRLLHASGRLNSNDSNHTLFSRLSIPWLPIFLLALKVS